MTNNPVNGSRYPASPRAMAASCAAQMARYPGAASGSRAGAGTRR
ncbi:MAG: hypothetical protein RL531_1824 [Actinomycetota bacterium]|jgi:hypothetical protein